ncbi:MAG: FecR domain-containing protein [Gammaproteobacteria bacterium]|nr:FecR domain-containing protein [Gammaproteobacteria bacterium]
MKHIKTICFLLFCFSSSAVNAKTEVGEVQYVRGVLTSQSDGEMARIIGKKSDLFNGDVLNTGTRGFAIIKLDDGTKMTLRPNTKFHIKDVNVKKGEETGFFSLIRGGFRAITGAISKRSASAFRVQTPVATIGIRGTEFDARLCDTDCNDENNKIKEASEEESPVIGRIALLRGKASSEDDKGKARPLSVGAAIYERDQIQTRMNSYAVIAFNDKSRVTMSPNSAFKIEEHQFKPEAPAENNAFVSFLRGGMRLVTGLIGKLNRPAYKVGTPTATIGIRGTGFDLVCEGRCVSEQSSYYNPVKETAVAKVLNFLIRPSLAADTNGMYAKVWSGMIELQLSSGTIFLKDGKAAFLKNGYTTPVILPDIPVRFRNMGGAPRPDKVDVKDDLFGGVKQEDVKPGLYVNVRQGDVQVQGDDGKVIDLGKGEAGLAGLDGLTARLKFIPKFQEFDPLPKPSHFNAKQENIINFLGLEKEEKSEFECTIQ